MRNPVFAANWKMNHGPQETRRRSCASSSRTIRRAHDRTVIFFRRALASHAVAGSRCSDRPDILFGVQNIHWEDKGAFTGENSAPIARDCRRDFVLVGHSERRQVFGETDEETARKMRRGRPRRTHAAGVRRRDAADERERGTTEPVVMRQLRPASPSRASANGVDARRVRAGVGDRHRQNRDGPPMRAPCTRRFAGTSGSAERTSATAVPILYGGSVNAGNTAELICRARRGRGARGWREPRRGRAGRDRAHLTTACKLRSLSGLRQSPQLAALSMYTFIIVLLILDASSSASPFCSTPQGRRHCGGVRWSVRRRPIRSSARGRRRIS